MTRQLCRNCLGASRVFYADVEFPQDPKPLCLTCAIDRAKSSIRTRESFVVTLKERLRKLEEKAI